MRKNFEIQKKNMKKVVYSNDASIENITKNFH